MTVAVPTVLGAGLHSSVIVTKADVSNQVALTYLAGPNSRGTSCCVQLCSRLL